MKKTELETHCSSQNKFFIKAPPRNLRKTIFWFRRYKLYEMRCEFSVDLVVLRYVLSTGI